MAYLPFRLMVQDVVEERHRPERHGCKRRWVLILSEKSTSAPHQQPKQGDTKQIYGLG